MKSTVAILNTDTQLLVTDTSVHESTNSYQIQLNVPRSTSKESVCFVVSQFLWYTLNDIETISVFRFQRQLSQCYWYMSFLHIT